MRLLCLAVCLASGTVVAADVPLPALIDAAVAAKQQSEEVAVAPQADAHTLIRRTTLDLVGRPATPQEVAAFVTSTDADKRAKLVDRLLASPAFARYQAYLFEAMLNGDSGGKNGGGLREYLTTALRENRPWDQMFREMMLPDESDAARKGASDFLRPKLNDTDRLTTEVAVAFFGVNVSCAQCHDHPHVSGWTQDHFYGMKSFLARSYDAGGTVGERAAGLVKYKPTKGPERQAKLMFLTGTVVDSDTVRELTKDEQKKDKELADKAKASKKAPPPPPFSARAKLVDVALEPKNVGYLSKNIVNRLWHRFLGFGLVNPLDQLHAENRPSHPGLLEALAKDTVAHQFDLKRLLRGIVLSETYSRSSRYDSEDFPLPSEFAVAQLKPLTPVQLGTALKLANTDPKTFDGMKSEDVEKRVEQIESQARGFASMIAMPTDHFQIGVSEALLFSNGDRVQKEFLSDGGGTLLGRLKTEKDATAAAKLMIETVFGRPAADGEAKAFADFAARRTDRQSDAYRHMLWALVTSAEFRFNH